MKPSSILGSCSRRALPRAPSFTIMTLCVLYPNDLALYDYAPTTQRPLLSPRGSHGGYGFNRPTPFPKVPRVLNKTPWTYGRASEIVGYLGTRKFPASLRGGTSFGPCEMCCTYLEMCNTFQNVICTS